MIELNDLFDYHKYIYQNSDYFKFSLDSVLLAEFVNIKKNDKRILDLCSGNVPVPLILVDKYQGLDITGVEIQKEIYDLGIKSIEYNNVNNIRLINDDVKNIPNVLDKASFDIVTVNPPYFKVYDEKSFNDNDIKAIARHEIKLTLDDTLLVASKMLKNQGYLYMVHRPERLADIILGLNKYNFGLKRVVSVYDKINGDCSMILIEAIYNGKDYVKIDNPIYLDKYTSYQNIFRK